MERSGVSRTTSFVPLAAGFQSQANVRRDLLLAPRLVQAADESSLSRGSFASASLSASCMPVRELGIDRCSWPSVLAISSGNTAME